jgi:hypothetical protein
MLAASELYAACLGFGPELPLCAWQPGSCSVASYALRDVPS